VAATLEASFATGEPLGWHDAYATTAEQLSSHAMTTYRRLVHEDPEFVRFFRDITPIGEIARLNIGSRPASRSSSGSIDDLRAIPWVFSWSQCRITLPAWYGVGAAFEHVADGWPGGHDAAVEHFREMHDRWPFFRSILANMGMVLAKTDLAIGARYAGLVTDAALRGRIFAEIVAEHERTLRWHAAVTGSDNLLAGNPSLARSIENRFPYLDPLHVLQVEMLHRHRNGDQDELVTRALELTINAIATGLRNSG
jgi:phosphoenolpyruvate carboxylase